jgi:hypothetical protein
MSLDRLVGDFKQLVNDLDEKKLHLNVEVPLYKDETQTYVSFNGGHLYGYGTKTKKDLLRLDATPENLLTLFKRYDKKYGLEEALVISNLRLERALKDARQ